MACQIRRRTVSDIVGLRRDKTPRQSIGVAIDLSSIAQTAFYTTTPGGTGMGLLIYRSIIEALGGRLWADQVRAAGCSLSVYGPPLTEPPRGIFSERRRHRRYQRFHEVGVVGG